MKRRAISPNERGMTLIEIIVVIVLISLVFTVVAKGVLGKGDETKAKLNVQKMNQLKATVERYRLEYNRFPSSMEDLTRKSSDIGDKLFVPMAKEEDLTDLWGFPYVYKPENNNRSFTLTTLGKDGIAGGDGVNQDVTVRP